MATTSSTRYNASANRYVDAKSGKFIAFETEAKIQLKLEKIANAAKRARDGSLRSVGYLIASLAKERIERSQRKSQPGQSPTTRRGLLKRAIRYEIAQDKQSVVIGPSFSIVGISGSAHEFGGKYLGADYPERPFMGPALQEALPLIGPTYVIS